MVKTISTGKTKHSSIELLNVHDKLIKLEDFIIQMHAEQGDVAEQPV
jgi:hypothetical protein